MTSRTTSGTGPRPIKRLSFEEIFGLSAITVGIFSFLHLAVAQEVALLTLLMGWTAPYFGCLCLGVGFIALFGYRLRFWRMEAMVGAYLLWLALIAGSFVWNHYVVDWRVVVDGSHGGMFGRALGNMLISLMGRTGAGVAIHAMAWTGFFLLIRYSPLFFGPLMVFRRITSMIHWQPHHDLPAVKVASSSPEDTGAASGKARHLESSNQSHLFSGKITTKAQDQRDQARISPGRRSAKRVSPQSGAKANPNSGFKQRKALTQSTAAVPASTTRSVRKKNLGSDKGRSDLPTLDLLSQSTIKRHEEQAQALGQALEKIYAEFAQPVKVVNIEIGPAVTRYGVKPLHREQNGKKRPVRVRDVLALRNDVAMGMEAENLRYLAPVPGRPYVGIEVPNSDRHIVDLRNVLDSWEFQNHPGPLKIGLGRATSGEAIIANLGRAPHLLVGGATGTGKSTCINVLLASLLMQHGPETLNLILVDPKQIELTPFDGLPHLVGRVATELEIVPTLLLWLLLEMEARFTRFREAGVRNISGYNKKVLQRSKEASLPYIVLVIDELADLMMMGDSQIESRLCRLAQKCRATGIHIVLATQRPSVDVVTGLIKSNFPTRIAFAVSSNTDSRVILDTPGAETLLGKGDMLFKDHERGKNVRVQGSWISDSDIQALVNYWKKQHRATPAEEQVEPWRGLLAEKSTGLATGHGVQDKS